MSYNGSGTFVINSAGMPLVPFQRDLSSTFNALTADLATGLSTAITKDGQTTTTALITFAAGISSTLVTDATSISTGSLLTSGGLGVTKAAWIGGLMNVAGAATLQSTLAVSGTSTMAAINASGDVVVRNANATDVLLTLGGNPTDNWSSRINLLSSTNQINWQISTNTSPASSGGFALTPSTSAGGSTFTTAALKIDSAGAVTIPGNVGIGGAANASQNITIPTASGSTSGVDQYGIFLNRTGVTGTNSSTALLSYIETSGTVASAYGVHTGVYKSSGTITTAYGLYVDDMIYGTTNYSIYTGAGKVRLGGNTEVTGTLGVTGATTLSAQTTFGERAYLNSTGRISVAGATTIYSIANGGASVGSSATLVLVNGYLVVTPTNSFIDLVLFMPSGTPSVISAINRGSPAARTYTSSGANLQLAMASGTYNVANSNTEQAC